LGPAAGLAFDLALEDLQLVAQDHDLHPLLHGRVTRGTVEQLQDAAENQVNDRTEHVRSWPAAWQTQASAYEYGLLAGPDRGFAPRHHSSRTCLIVVQR